MLRWLLLFLIFLLCNARTNSSPCYCQCEFCLWLNWWQDFIPSLYYLWLFPIDKILHLLLIWVCLYSTGWLNHQKGGRHTDFPFILCLRVGGSGLVDKFHYVMKSLAAWLSWEKCFWCSNLSVGKCWFSWMKSGTKSVWWSFHRKAVRLPPWPASHLLANFAYRRFWKFLFLNFSSSLDEEKNDSETWNVWGISGVLSVQTQPCSNMAAF